MDDRILEHYLEEFRSGEDLDSSEAETLMDALIGCGDTRLIAEVLDAWNTKSTSEDELYSMAAVLRSRMTRITSDHPVLVDIVGTGGSRVKTFNVSTASSFVVAGSGLAVAKHGNRKATSSSGSSDVLSELGVETDVAPEKTESTLRQHGVCFMFAPRFHKLSAAIAEARRALGVPTIFNNLGPLCNPASAPFQLIGVSDPRLVDVTARVLARLGTQRSWILHAANGLDEISIAGTTRVVEVSGKTISTFEIAAPDFGVYSLGKGLPGACTIAESARIIRDILENRMPNSDPERLVLMNAAAAIHLPDPSSNLAETYEIALESLRSGSAMHKLCLLAGLKK